MEEPRLEQSRDIFVQPRQSTPEPGLYANAWAIVIGIDRYADSRVPALRFAERDAEAIAAQLPSVGFPPENITLLLASRSPEKIEIASLLKLLHDDLHRKMNKDDQFLFYFAGHGVTSVLDDRRRGYLLLPASTIGEQWPSRERPYLDDVPGDALETATLRATIDGLRPRHKLVILDACFSGLIMSPRSAYAPLEVSDRSVAAWRSRRVTQILTAGGAGEQALESDGYGHGVFTHFLLRGLDDGVRPGQKIVPASEISSYVRERVSSESPQNPQSQNDGEGEFLFVRQPVRSRQSQVEELCGMAAAALAQNDVAAAEATLKQAAAVAGEAADLLAVLQPLSARIAAIRTADQVAVLIAEADTALGAGQLTSAAAKAAEAEKLALSADHIAAVARLKAGIAEGTGAIASAACLRDAETALAAANWKLAAAKLAEARGVSSGAPPALEKLAAFEKKLHESANARAQKLLEEIKSSTQAKKFAAARTMLAEVRALPTDDAALAKAVADVDANLAAAQKASGTNWDGVLGGVVVVVGLTAAFFLIRFLAPYLALGVKADFWSMVSKSCAAWFASLHWYGWLAVIAGGLILLASAQDSGKAVPAVLFFIWLALRFWGPNFDHATIDRLMGKAPPPSTFPIYQQPRVGLPSTDPNCTTPLCKAEDIWLQPKPQTQKGLPSVTQPGSAAWRLLHEPALDPKATKQ